MTARATSSSFSPTLATNFSFAALASCRWTCLRPPCSNSCHDDCVHSHTSTWSRSCKLAAAARTSCEAACASAGGVTRHQLPRKAASRSSHALPRPMPPAARGRHAHACRSGAMVDKPFTASKARTVCESISRAKASVSLGGRVRRRVGQRKIEIHVRDIVW